jgi:hypothetical protein
MSTAIFYHAGCPVCLEAEQKVVDAIDRSKYQAGFSYQLWRIH